MLWLIWVRLPLNADTRFAFTVVVRSPYAQRTCEPCSCKSDTNRLVRFAVIGFAWASGNPSYLALAFGCPSTSKKHKKFRAILSSSLSLSLQASRSSQKLLLWSENIVFPSTRSSSIHRTCRLMINKIVEKPKERKVFFLAIFLCEILHFKRVNEWGSHSHRKMIALVFYVPLPTISNDGIHADKFIGRCVVFVPNTHRTTEQSSTVCYSS